jgi:uncharacterized protein YcfL
MKRLLITTLATLILVACSKQAQTPSASKETSYPMTATIVSRDPAKKRSPQVGVTRTRSFSP